ncbi:MAG: EF-hand domain-containing protein [Sphingomicrobium sp.]
MSKTTLIAALMLCLASGAPAQTAAQAPSSNNVPRADYIATMDVEYSKMDGDKNGKVTRAEIETFDRGVALGQARARAQALFAQLDVDRNGQLSLVEFGKTVSGSPQVDGRPLLNKFDINKDGSVSLIEHRAGKLAYFDQIDSDKDGVVTVVEMKAAGVIK